MEILVSTSLKGRDLAIIKSLININNIYGDTQIVYTDENTACQFLITQDLKRQRPSYYALNQLNGEKINITPDLNPQSVRNLFSALANSVPAKQDSSVSTEQAILDYCSSGVSSNNLLIEVFDESVMLDKTKQLLYSTTSINSNLLMQLHKQASRVKLIEREATDTKSYAYCKPLELFNWELGYCHDDQLIDEAFKASDKAFKQVTWPNYGECEFVQEFIKLSSILCKRSETYTQLLKISGYEAHTINQFLNATLIAGHVIVIDNHRPAIKPLKHRHNPFISGLKRLFAFN